MKPHEIRQKFLNFFRSKGHEIVPSDSLVPSKDPTLLFTTAGMVQFKSLYAGAPLQFSRAATVQKCLRAGGKGSDLENVGKTLRHHTFFEMLGNFSFGDYFKKEAIAFAWEFLLEVLSMDLQKLWVSVYEEDEEAKELWIKQGFPAERIVKLGKKDNFWGPAGSEGACGPCSEIYYDLGPDYSCGSKDCKVGCDCERYLEFWNLVFPQYYQEKDGTMTLLKRRGVDTGMGLERISFLMDPDARNNYETDIFKQLINALGKKTQKPYEKPWIASYHVISDHIRALTFAIGDGILPSNEGRGYVVRRILRRALRFGKKLGLEKPFLNELTPIVVDQMKCQYPDLEKNLPMIQKIVSSEEERFLFTLNKCLSDLESVIETEKKKGNEVIKGELMFTFYDTFGLPLEIMEEVVQEQQMALDFEGFERLMEEQKQKGKKSWKGTTFSLERTEKLLENVSQITHFLGYQELETESKILLLISEDGKVEEVNSGQVQAVLDQTVFYAESGGQIADQGEFAWVTGKADVLDVQKSSKGIFLHTLEVLEGTLKVGQKISGKVKKSRRYEIQKHHTATHILQYVLRKQLGEHIKQAGSFVSDERLRFDFSHTQKLSSQKIKEIEDEVNQIILESEAVEIKTINLKEAQTSKDILANFGEKYGESVRLVKVGKYSKELCGGTHINCTGLMNGFKIISESSVSAGIRRIEAVTGKSFINLLQEQSLMLQELVMNLKAPANEILAKFQSQNEKIKELEKKLEERMTQTTQTVFEEILEEKNIQIVIQGFDGMPPKALMEEFDSLKKRHPTYLFFLSSVFDGKIHYLAGANGVHGFDCNNWLKSSIALAGGKGGGKPDMARGAAPKSDKFKTSLKKASEIIHTWLDSYVP